MYLIETTVGSTDSAAVATIQIAVWMNFKREFEPAYRDVDWI